MDMDLQKARELVVEAGKKLVETGLIARTWGNVSCRVSDSQFVITPSGRAYETLTPEEIVLVNIADCSYDGDIKPSSEKGIHAECYRLRPEMNFVIHTHQLNASVVSAIGYDINVVAPESAAVIGSNVPSAKYGLPGTPMLKKGVVEALQRSDSKAVIMRHHGAVCLGESYEDAFSVAHELEKVCANYLLERCAKLSNAVADTWESVRDYFLENTSRKTAADVPQAHPYNSVRDGNAFEIMEADGITIGRMDIRTGNPISGKCPPEAELHRAIYAKRKDINAILHSREGDILAVSRTGLKLCPLLDDLAQICGATVKNAVFNPNSTIASSKKVVRALRGRSAVLLRDNGAVCCGPSEFDAQATRMVMEKGCKAQVGMSLFGKVKPINPIETRLMRFIYMKKYSKQASK